MLPSGKLLFPLGGCHDFRGHRRPRPHRVGPGQARRRPVRRAPGQPAGHHHPDAGRAQRPRPRAGRRRHRRLRQPDRRPVDSTSRGRRRWSPGFPEAVPGDTRRPRSAARASRPRTSPPRASSPGAYDVVIACGVESMSRVPMGTQRATAGTRSAPLAERYPDGWSARASAPRSSPAAGSFDRDPARRILGPLAPAGGRRRRGRRLRRRDLPVSGHRGTATAHRHDRRRDGARQHHRRGTGRAQAVVLPTSASASGSPRSTGRSPRATPRR